MPIEQPDNAPISQTYSTKLTTKANHMLWWTCKKENQHEAIFNTINSILKSQVLRARNLLRYLQIYSNYEYSSLASGMFNNTVAEQNNTFRVSINETKAIVDTIHAKISQNRARTQILSIGGDYKLQRIAQQLTKYLDGVYEDAHIYQIAQKVFKDSAVFGTGYLHIYVCPDAKKIKVERVLPDEMICDTNDGIYQAPRSRYRTKWINRQQLLAIFGGKDIEKQLKDSSSIASKIMQATSASKSLSNTSPYSDQIKVVEAWHLPSSKKAGDGTHAIAINNATLLSEPYNKSYYPILVFRYEDKFYSDPGAGIVANLEMPQHELNFITRRLAEGHRYAVSQVWIDKASGIAQTKVNNEVGNIFKYSGNPPVQIDGTTMPAAMYQYRDTIKNDMWVLAGASQLSGSSQIPPGLKSGEAIKTYQNVETQRLAVIGQCWENFVAVDVSKVIIDLSRDEYKNHNDIKVNTISGKFIQSIQWSNASLEENEFLLQCFPTSLLPTTPEGKLDAVEDLIQGGWIDKSAGQDLLQIPDLDQYFDLQNAPLNNAKRVVALILDEGEVEPPEDFDNLAVYLAVAIPYVSYAKNNNVDKKHIDLLRTFIVDIMTLQNKQAMAQQQQQPQTQAANAQASQQITQQPTGTTSNPTPQQ